MAKPLDLGDKAMAAWMSRLPKDVLDAIGAPVASPQGLEFLRFDDPAAMASMLREHEDVVAGMGRPRRVRLMAWMYEHENPADPRGVVRQVFDGVAESGEGGDEKGGGGDRVGMLFMRDFVAIAELVHARRALRGMTDGQAVRAAIDAAFTLEGEMSYAAGQGQPQ